MKAYNTRSHSTTLFSPFHLFQGRKYHDYLPVFDSWDGTYELPPTRSTVKENDDRAKAKQKSYYDKRNKTRDPGIKEGDWVLMKNTNRINKMEPWFIVPRFRVMRIHKAMAIVRSSDGKDFIRWIGHLKLDVERNSEVPDGPISSEDLSELLNSQLNVTPEIEDKIEKNQIPENDNEIDDGVNGTLTNNTQTDRDKIQLNANNNLSISTAFNLRNRKLINIPARYQVIR